MYAKIYNISKYWDDFDNDDMLSHDYWICKYLDEVKEIYDYTISITKDKDITDNYYIEALTTGVKRLNYNREKEQLFDPAWMDNVVTHIMLTFNDTDNDDFQYHAYSSGYLAFLDEAATVYCLTGHKISFLFIYNQIINYINNALKDKKKLLRGLSYYDKVNHNMFALIIRKYLKLSEVINKDDVDMNISTDIIGLDDKDREYILGDEIADIMTAAEPNRRQESSTKIAMDMSAQGMIEKYLKMKN